MTAHVQYMRAAVQEKNIAAAAAIVHRCHHGIVERRGMKICLSVRGGAIDVVHVETQPHHTTTQTTNHTPYSSAKRSSIPVLASQAHPLAKARGCAAACKLLVKCSRVFLARLLCESASALRPTPNITHTSHHHNGH